MAPPDCLQYHTGPTGTFRSFNHPDGNYIRGQMYQICIRTEYGRCGAMYSVNQIRQNVVPFGIDSPLIGVAKVST